MLRYASSLGIASGINAQEAHLHGLCELIEHDAFSHALLRWFIARMPQVLIVDISSLPDHVKLLYDIAAETAGAEVFLLDVTTDIGVPLTSLPQVVTEQKPVRWVQALPRLGTCCRTGAK